MKEDILSNFDFHNFYIKYIPDLPNKEGWISCCSPFRKDNNPSFSLNLFHGGWKDFATGESGNVYDFIEKAENIHVFKEKLKFLNSFGANIPIQERKNGSKKIEPIPADVVQHFLNNLQADLYDEIRKQLKKRCISKKTCAEFKVGALLKKFKDPKKDSFLEYQSFFIPYKFDKSGSCTDYKFIPYHEGKKVNNFIRTKGSAQIFPSGNLIFDDIVLCEGELDALTLSSNGFRAVTATAGAGTFTNELAENFENKDVTILYDNDKEGRDGSQKAAQLLYGIAKSVKIADWNNNVYKYDVGDYFQENDNIDVLLDIIQKASPYLPQTTVNRITKLNKEKEIERKKREVFDFIYKETERGHRLVHSHVAEYVVENEDYPLCSTLPDPSSIRRLFYWYEDGIWKIVNRDFVKMIVINLLTLPYSDYEVNQIVNLIGTLSSVEPSLFNSRSDLINLRNCTYDLVHFKAIEHSKEFYFTYKNDYDYDPKIPCVEFNDALCNYSMDADGNIDERWILGFWEVLGYCLTGNYEIHKMFWFFGSQGGEGKSTLTRIMSKIVGPELTKPNLDPDHLSGQFYKGSLIGKRLAITGELPEFVNNVETIKQLTGEDEQSTDVKFKEQVNFKNSAKLVFSMNRLPTFPAKTPIKPILRRIFLLPFDNPIKKLDSTIENRFRLELSGIFNNAIQGLKRLRDNRNKFTVCNRAKQILKMYAKETNIVAEFIDSFLKSDKKGQVWAWQVWDAFVKYMDSSSQGQWANDKSNPSNTQKLGQALRTFLDFKSFKVYCVEKGGLYTKYIGISFLSEIEKREKSRLAINEDVPELKFEEKEDLGQLERGYFDD